MSSINNFMNMLWAEILKATRSKMPIFTLGGFMLIPLMATFFMVILARPRLCSPRGLISDKAQLMAGTADWPTFLSLLAQAVAVGGTILFSLIGSWVFGREFVDGTLKDLLAVPVGRTTILLAKFLTVMLWSFLLAVLMYCIALLLGMLIALPQGNAQILWQGTLTYMLTAALVIATLTPVAFFASVGRGYLLPIGATILFVLFANVLTVAGWGSYFPWAIPALYAGAGDQTVTLAAESYWIVLLTSLAGIFATCLWWRFADQNK